jgi:hypothetical protein
MDDGGDHRKHDDGAAQNERLFMAVPPGRSIYPNEGSPMVAQGLIFERALVPRGSAALATARLDKGPMKAG